MTSAIKGNIDNKTIGQKIISVLFSQVRESIVSIRMHYSYSSDI